MWVPDRCCILRACDHKAIQWIHVIVEGFPIFLYLQVSPQILGGRTEPIWKYFIITYDSCLLGLHLGFVSHVDTPKATLNKTTADTESKTGCSHYFFGQQH